MINQTSSGRYTFNVEKNKGSRSGEQKFTEEKLAVNTCSPIFDRPDMVNGKKISMACDGYVIIIEKVNEKYYKVKVGSITGYLHSMNILSKETDNKKILSNKKLTDQSKISKRSYSEEMHAVNTCSPIFDKPDMVSGKKIGMACNGYVKIIEQINEKYYKVKSGSITGYLYYGNLK